MIVVPQNVLMKQMEEEFVEGEGRKPSFTGLRTSFLAGNWEGMKEERKTELLAADIVIASLDSLAQFRYPKSLMTRFGLVVFDEAHHMAARTLCEVLPRLPTRRIAGFSATPQRTDGLVHLLFWILGPPCFVFQRVPEVTGRRGTVHVRGVNTPNEVQAKTMFGGNLAFAEMLNDLAADSARNALIINLCRNQLEAGRRKVLVITAFREHAELLLSEAKKLTDLAVLLYGGMSKKQKPKHEALVAARVLVATYGVLQEGFDDADLDTLIMATPRSTVQQTVGRVERVKDGKLTPLVLDLIDNHSLYTSMWWKRRAFYASRGFRIEGGARTPSEEEIVGEKRRREFDDDAVMEEED